MLEIYVNGLNIVQYLETTHHFDGNTVRCACAKNEAKVSCRRDERCLVGTLGLILQSPVDCFRHYRMAEREQAKEIVGMLLVRSHGIQ